MREHLSPRYSQISKPLRDDLTTLQEKRRAGQVKGKARFLPNRSHTNDSWPTFWSDECQTSFTTLKHLA